EMQPIALLRTPVGIGVAAARFPVPRAGEQTASGSTTGPPPFFGVLESELGEAAGKAGGDDEAQRALAPLVELGDPRDGEGASTPERDCVVARVFALITMRGDVEKKGPLRRRQRGAKPLFDVLDAGARRRESHGGVVALPSHPGVK